MHVTNFLQRTIRQHPSLHLPDVEFDTEESQARYFKRMIAFYAGLFSWWTQQKDEDGVQFTATVLKAIFQPPRADNLQTVGEKSCLAFFVDNVLFKLFSALKLSLRQISVFYRTWDSNRVVLTAYDQVSQNPDARILQFKKYIQAQKNRY